MTPGETLATVEEELDRWRARERDLQQALRAIVEEGDRLQEELDRIDQQVTYYGSLTGDMKRQVQRPNLSSLLSSFRRP